MKIYILTDLEGACYASGFDQVSSGHRLYSFLTKMLTEEVNTAVDSLLEEGVEKVYVLDGHGAGGIDLEHFDRRAYLLTGRPFLIPWGFDADDFDAVFIIGQHGAAGIGEGAQSGVVAVGHNEVFVRFHGIGAGANGQGVLVVVIVIVVIVIVIVIVVVGIIVIVAVVARGHGIVVVTFGCCLVITSAATCRSTEDQDQKAKKSPPKGQVPRLHSILLFLIWQAWLR